MLSIRNTLDVVTKHLSHLGWQNKFELRFENVTDTALPRLRVNADNVRLVHSANVGRVDGKIGHRPGCRIPFHTVFHTLRNGVLVRTRECRKDECAAIWLPLEHLHPCHSLVHFANGRKVRKIKARINPLGIHIQGEGNHVYVARTFAVTKQRALYSVTACKQPHFTIRNCATSVVVRVQGNDKVLTVF